MLPMLCRQRNSAECPINPAQMALALALLSITAGCASTSPQDPRPVVQHVVVLGIDGLSAQAIRRAYVPGIRLAMERGAYTLAARCALPTSSQPNWASHLMGSLPTQHGVLNNQWIPGRQELPPVETTPGGMFPTIFRVLYDQRPQATVAVFHEWPEIERLVEPYVANTLQQDQPSDRLLASALNYLRKHRPTLLFICLDLVDFAGHEHGWGSQQYLRAVEQADAYVSYTMEALRETGLESCTVLMIISDHGGHGRSHGGVRRAEIEVPWIITGPGVARGRELSGPVYVYDTAATIARLLNLKPPASWIGRPVAEALDAAPPDRCPGLNASAVHRAGRKAS